MSDKIDKVEKIIAKIYGEDWKETMTEEDAMFARSDTIWFVVDADTVGISIDEILGIINGTKKIVDV